MLLCITFPLQAHDRVDSLAQRFESARGQHRSDVANELLLLLYQEEVTDTLIQLPAHLDGQHLAAEVYYWAGEKKFISQDFKASSTYFEKALALIPRDSLERRSDCLNDLSISYARMGLYSQALTAATQTVEIDQQLRDKERLAYSLNNLGGIYLMARQPVEAAKYTLRSLELARELNDSVKMAVRYGALAEMEQIQQNYPQALRYAREAYRLDSLRGDRMKMAVRQVQMANALQKQGRTGEADGLLRQANPVLRAAGNLVSLAICLNQQGYSALMRAQWKESAEYYEQAYLIYNKTGDRNSKLTSLWGLWHAYSRMEPSKALDYMEYYASLKDSIYQADAARLGAEYDARYQNAELNRQNEEMRQRNRLLTIGGAAAFAVMLAIISLLAYALRKKRQTERLQGVLREERNSSVKASNTDLEFLNKVDQLLNQQMADCNVNQEDIASALCITRQTLNRKMKALLGESMRDYVSRYRTERACRLLESDESTVSEVARACGFDDVAYFSRFFRKMTGQSPSEYKVSSCSPSSAGRGQE